MPLLSRDYGAAIAFLFAAATTIPWFLTHGRLGLAIDEHEESDSKIVRDVARRQALLSSHCPRWKITWPLPIAYTGIAFIAYIVFPDHVNPIYALCGTLCFQSGFWFAFVYPIARQVLDETNRKTEK